MGKKESVVKAVGRFAANELLGVDDVRRAVSKVKQGDIKGAVKSAATAALEAGSTVAGAGLGAKLGAKAGLKVGEKFADAGAKRVSEVAAKNVAERTPRGSLGKEGGEKFTKKVEPTKRTTVSDSTGKEKAGTYGGSKVEGTTPKRTMDERIGDAKRGDTNRTKKISQAQADTYDAAREASLAPAVGKAMGKVSGGAAGVAAVAATKKVEAPKGSQANHHVTDSKNHTKTVK